VQRRLVAFITGVGVARHLAMVGVEVVIAETAMLEAVSMGIVVE
jgi:hypothetical protein